MKDSLPGNEGRVGLVSAGIQSGFVGLLNWLPFCFVGTKVCVPSKQQEENPLTRCIQFRSIPCKWPWGRLWAEQQRGLFTRSLECDARLLESGSVHVCDLWPVSVAGAAAGASSAVSPHTQPASPGCRLPDRWRWSDLDTRRKEALLAARLQKAGRRGGVIGTKGQPRAVLEGHQRVQSRITRVKVGGRRRKSI